MPTTISNYNRPMKTAGGVQSSMLGPQVFEYFDDFNKAYPLIGSVPVTASSPYNGLLVGAGTFAQTVTTDAFGVAIFSGAATTDKTGVQIQYDHAGIQFAAGNVYEYAVRVKLSTASASDFAFGLGTQNTTAHALLTGTRTSGSVTSNIDITDFADFIGIYKPCANAVTGGLGFYGIHNLTGGTATATAAWGASNTSYTILGLQVLMGQGAAGGCLVNFWQDGTLASYTTIPTITTGQLAPIIAFQSGSAVGTQTASVDWHSFEGTR